MSLRKGDNFTTMKKDGKFGREPKATLEGAVQTTDQGSASNMDTEIKSPAGGAPEIKTIEEPKASINTKRAAEAVSSGSTSAGTLGGLRRGAITFGGGAGSINGDNSATTRENSPYKSGDRTGRRVDSITKKIDYLDAEIFETKMYQSKPLSETDEGMGYNGNYYNEHVITQRNSGGAPADPTFERSIDQIALDMIYYPTGQVNGTTAQKTEQLRSYNPTTKQYSNVTATLGNYFNRRLNVTINNQGAITAFNVDSYDMSENVTDELAYRAAGDALLRVKNQRELDRQVMIAKAGNESDPAWSALPEAIDGATAFNRVIPYLEGMAGDYTYLSERKLSEALAYQINKAGKDGARAVGPIAEMMNGCVPVVNMGADSSVSEANGRTLALSTTALLNGGCCLWLGVNDSLPKYTTKGKFLSLPLSFKSALSTVRSNKAPLRMDALLCQEMEKNELFSTIDGPYDPLKPVVLTDKASIFTALPLDFGCDFNDGVYNTDIMTIHYENLRNKYNLTIRNYFMEGLYRWFHERAERIYNLYTQFARNEGITPSNSIDITIPIVSSSESISLWDLIVCSITPYVVEARIATMTELLKYERNHGYPYTGLVDLASVDINKADNYSFNGEDAGLTTGIAKPIAAMKVILPELFWPIRKINGEQWSTGHNGYGAYVVLPHYFNQQQFAYDDEEDNVQRNLLLSENFATMSYPSTRSGQMFSYLDTIYGMSEEDYKLSLDRMVVYPAYEGFGHSKWFGTASAVPGVADAKAQAVTYKYGLVTDGLPVLPYFAYADDSDNRLETLTVGDILSTPRELGLMQVAPAGLLTPIRQNSGGDLNTVNVDSSYLVYSGPGFRVKVYHGTGNNMEDAILEDGSINLTENASFANDWLNIYASPDDAGFDFGIILNATRAANSMVPFTTGSYEPNEGAFNFNTGMYDTNEAQVENGDDFIGGVTIGSRQKYIWTRLQRLPFIISPFDVNTADLTSGNTGNINSMDIFDFLYYFGLAGFRASDYRELVNKRSKERVAKGMNYVSDPFVDKSLLLK